MSKYMSANEANMIAKENDNRIVKAILKEVENEAKNGEFSVKFRIPEFVNGSHYKNGATPEQERTLNKLRSLGYEAQIVIEENESPVIYFHVLWS